MKDLFKTIYIEKHRICFKFRIGNANLKTNRIVEVRLKRILLRLLKINKITVLVLNKQTVKATYL